MNENTGVELPPLSDATIERMERAVLDAVEDESRMPDAPPPPHRVRRRWITGLGIAAAFAVGAMVSPSLINLGMSATSETMPAMGDNAGDSGGDSAGAGAEEAITSDSSASSPDGGAVSSDGDVVAENAAAGREIITTADLSLLVTDIAESAEEIADVAADFDGYVEASDIGAYGQTDTSVPAPVDQGMGWVSIRIPAKDLTAVTAQLGELGEVTRSSISRQDVTAITVDLQARIDAAQTSVDRLTELMSQSGSVGDLIAAESALSERQAQLESYQQELKNLTDQVSMSTVSVQLSERAAVADADPAGFSDGLLAGWNGLVATLNGLVIALGFALPWLAIAAVVVLVIWLIRRRARRPKSAEER